MPLTRDHARTLHKEVLQAFPSRGDLAQAHAWLAAAVLPAYGWPADLADAAILERLLAHPLQQPFQQQPRSQYLLCRHPHLLVPEVIT